MDALQWGAMIFIVFGAGLSLRWGWLCRGCMICGS